MATIGELKPKLGEQITFAQTGEWYAGTTATIIAIDRNDENQPYLVGWRASPNGHEGKSGTDPRHMAGCLVIDDFDSYPYNTWVHHTREAAMAIHKGGMKCAGRHCGTFNEYAAPNQPDGKTFLCYSCREKPECLR